MRNKLLIIIIGLVFVSIFLFDVFPKAEIIGVYDNITELLKDTVLTGTTTMETATVDSAFVGGHGDPRGMADSTFTGDPVIWKADENIKFGEVCYRDGDQEFALGDADVLTTAKVKVICVQRNGVQANAYGKFLHRGYVYFTPWTTITVAEDSTDVYVGTTAGQPTIVRPSGTGDTAVIIGEVVAEDKIFFNPMSTYVGVP